MTPKVKALWTLYQHDRITKAQLKEKIPTMLTEEEYEQITGAAPKKQAGEVG